MILENIPLTSYTYYKIGGPARYFSQPKSIQELIEAASWLKSSKVPFFILGAGSNVLFDDHGFNGLVLQTSKLDHTFVQTENEIEVGASVMVIQLLRHCMAMGVTGFEFLVGVPGNMGGVFFMNAGTKFGEIQNVVNKITVFNLDTCLERVISKEEIHYSYRTQHFLQKNEIIFRGKMKVTFGDPKTVQKTIQDRLDARKRTQPIDKPSCGSVFKNPDPEHGIYAWQLIDKVGLRGYRMGQAQISHLHTNFIVNLGGAKSADVQALITEAKKRVWEQCGVKLEEEVKVIQYDDRPIHI